MDGVSLRFSFSWNPTTEIPFNVNASGIRGSVPPFAPHLLDSTNMMPNPPVVGPQSYKQFVQPTMDLGETFPEDLYTIGSVFGFEGHSSLPPPAMGELSSTNLAQSRVHPGTRIVRFRPTV